MSFWVSSTLPQPSGTQAPQEPALDCWCLPRDLHPTTTVQLLLHSQLTETNSFRNISRCSTTCLRTHTHTCCPFQHIPSTNSLPGPAWNNPPTAGEARPSPGAQALVLNMQYLRGCIKKLYLNYWRKTGHCTDEEALMRQHVHRQPPWQVERMRKEKRRADAGQASPEPSMLAPCLWFFQKAGPALSLQEGLTGWRVGGAS